MKKIHGYAHSQFSKVKEVFKQNFDEGLEPAGAAFAVYYNGKLVADLYGGCANLELKEPVTTDSMFNYFSITKSLSATVLALLIDRGRANYDDLVCKYWPEFAKNGKNAITIKDVVQHQAGTPFGEIIFTVNHVNDHCQMSKILEEMSPIWPPGSQNGYHAFTFGFLVDQIVRRIDEQRRGVEQIFREEIVTKYDIDDIYIGLPNDELNKRVAKIYDVTDDEIEVEKRVCPEGVENAMLFKNENYDKIFKQFPWMTISDHNDASKRRLRMPSNMGIGTARALAKVHSLIACKKLFSEEMHALLSIPTLIDHLDVVLGYKDSKGHGWIYNRNKIGNDWLLGHSGQGGQNVCVDVNSRLAYAYVCNGLKYCDSEHVFTFQRLKHAVYESIKAN